MEVVAPLRIQCRSRRGFAGESAGRCSSRSPQLNEIGDRDNRSASAQPSDKILEESHRRQIIDCMHRIEPQRVNMKMRLPIRGRYWIK